MTFNKLVAAGKWFLWVRGWGGEGGVLVNTVETVKRAVLTALLSKIRMVILDKTNGETGYAQHISNNATSCDFLTPGNF